MDLAVANAELVIGEMKVLFQPFQECRLEDAALSIESVAGQPDEFRLAEVQAADVLQLDLEFLDVNNVCDAHRRMPINQGKLDPSFWKILPDELQHQ